MSKGPLIAGIAVVFAALAVALFFGLRSDKPTATVTSSSIGETDARKVIVNYLNDINDQDESDAQTLICAPLVAGWKTSIHDTHGDFTYTIEQATFAESTPKTAGLELHYSLDIKDRRTAAKATTKVTFTVVEEAGDLRICGES